MIRNPREAIDRINADMRTELHTSFPAKVVSYDADAQTVDVLPAIMREVAGDDPQAPYSFEAIEELGAVPVMWPRAGGFVLTFPIAVGDWVLIICAEQSTLLWRVSGSAPVKPGLIDPHGLNGCVALPGWFPDTQKLEDVSTTDVVLGKADGSSGVRVKPDGSVVLGPEAGAGLVALAAKCDAEFAKISTTFASFSPGSGGAAFVTPYPPLPATPGSPPASVAAEKVSAK